MGTAWEKVRKYLSSIVWSSENSAEDRIINYQQRIQEPGIEHGSIPWHGNAQPTEPYW